MVNEEVAKQRMSICETCPEYRPAIYVCSQCGCFMLLKTKFEFSRCPLGKWMEVISNEQ